MTLTQNPPAVRESPAITIGDRVLATRYFLAPLAGYTHLPFRTAVRELGGVGLSTTDLILTSQMLAESRKSKRLLQTTAADRPLSVQIFGSDPDELAEGAKFLEGRGYGGV
ncbi:MAG: tRNA-dihydrouridine synthase, partial [Planctomycetota bacterium]